MTYPIPDLPTLIARAQGDLNLALSGTDAKLRRSNVAVLARTHAAGVSGLYGYLGWIARQLFVLTCDEEQLMRDASIWLAVPQYPAESAGGNLIATGINGRTIPAGTVIQRGDGVQVTSAADAVVVARVATVAVTANVAGSAGNTAPGTALTLVSPVDGINSVLTVDAYGLYAGVDVESLASVRARLVRRLQEPPQGGDMQDYIDWTLAIPGVTRAWCAKGEMGAGTVTVRFAMDNAYANGIPSAGDVANVLGILQSTRPVTAGLYVVAPLPNPVNYTISGLSPNNSATQGAITAALSALIVREGAPGGTLLWSHQEEAISTATGVNDQSLVSPASNVICATGYLPVMGATTWL